MIDQLYYDSIDLLRELIATPRTSRHEDSAANLVADFFTRHGLTPRRIFNNVIVQVGRHDPERPTLLLNSHIDTVPPVAGWTRDPHAADIVDDCLYGLGANDAGASLVSLMAVACYMHANPALHPHYNIVFVASAEEEVSGARGIEAVLPSLPHIDVAIVGEPTGLNPAVAEKGLIVIDATIAGQAAHAASGQGINAIYRAVDYINTLRSTSLPVSDTLGPVHITVAQIDGGIKHNVVPDTCRLVIDVRTTDAMSNTDVMELLRRDLPDYITLTPRSLRLNPSGIDTANPLIQRLVTLGRTPYGSPTLSDQALMPWPSFKLGPGNSTLSHAPDEYIPLPALREAQALYLTLLTHAHIL